MNYGVAKVPRLLHATRRLSRDCVDGVEATRRLLDAGRGDHPKLKLIRHAESAPVDQFLELVFANFLRERRLRDQLIVLVRDQPVLGEGVVEV